MNWEILYNPVAFADRLNDKRDSAAYMYFEEDRARLQELMDRGYDGRAERSGRALGRGATAVMGGDLAAYDAETARRAEANRPKYGPYAEAAQMGADQRAGEINANLARQLALAEGRGPSLAAQQYRSAQQEGVNASASIAAGRGAAAQRLAAQNIARSNAGLAAGVTEARTREQLGHQTAYNQALQSAQKMDADREALNVQLQQQTAAANQQAYLDLLAKQLGLSVGELQERMFNAQQPTYGDRLINAWSFGLAGAGGAGGG
jgi:hypothetical protein